MNKNSCLNGGVIWIFIALMLLIFFYDANTQTVVPYRIRMPDSTYSAQLRGRTGTRTAGLTITGVWDGTNFKAHEFDVEVDGHYDLYYDPAGGSTYFRDAQWSGSYGKFVVTGYFFNAIDTDGDALVDALDDSIVGLNNLTQATLNYIGAGGTVTNNPDDESIINVGPTNLGVNPSWMDTTGTLWKLYGDPDETGLDSVGVYAHLNTMKRFNVNDYGAVGDSTTDDYTALQATIDAAAVSGGDVLLSGKYRFSETLIVPSGVRLVGTARKHLDTFGGWQTANIIPNLIFSGDSVAIKIQYASHDRYQHSTSIRDIIMTYSGSDANTDGIQVDSASVVFDNLMVVGFTGDGYDIGICWFSTMNDIRATYCDSSGIYLHSEETTAPTGQITFINPTITHCTWGYRAYNTLITEMVGGTVALCDSYQVWLQGSSEANFQGVLFEPELNAQRTNWGDLVFVDSVKIGAQNIKSANISFYNCSFYAGASGANPQYDVGIHVEDTQGFKIEHCEFKDFQEVAIDIVYSTAVVTKYFVGHNYYYNCTDEFDETASSAQGIFYEQDNNEWVYKRQNLQIEAGNFALSSSWEYPMSFGADTTTSRKIWPDSTGLFRYKTSGNPTSHTDGTVIGYPSRWVAGAPHGSTTPYDVGEMYYETDGDHIYIATGASNADWEQATFADSVRTGTDTLFFHIGSDIYYMLKK